MSYTTDELVRRLVDQQLLNNPRSRSLYNTDAQFRAAVEVGRGTLQVVASAMDHSGVPPWQAEEVLRATLERMLSDRQLAEHDEQVKLVTRPLWDKLMSEQHLGEG